MSASSDHAWAKKKWSLNRDGLLIEVKCIHTIHGINTYAQPQLWQAQVAL